MSEIYRMQHFVLLLRSKLKFILVWEVVRRETLFGWKPYEFGFDRAGQCLCTLTWIPRLLFGLSHERRSKYPGSTCYNSGREPRPHGECECLLRHMISPVWAALLALLHVCNSALGLSPIIPSNRIRFCRVFSRQSWLVLCYWDNRNNGGKKWALGPQCTA